MLKKSHLQIFSEIFSLRNFAIFTRKHLCWEAFLIKLQAFRPVTFLKRDSNTGVSSGYCEIVQNSFCYRTPPVAVSDSPATVQ